MILAAMRDNTYNVVLFIHIASFLVAFAPAVINPLLEAYFTKNGGEPVLRTWAGFTSDFTAKISLPALGVLLITGVAMLLMSDDVLEFSQTWVSLAFLVWFALGGVVSAMILKGEKQVAAGQMSGLPLVKKGGMIGTLLMLVMLYLMIFKPGL